MYCTAVLGLGLVVPHLGVSGEWGAVVEEEGDGEISRRIWALSETAATASLAKTTRILEVIRA